MKKRNPIWGCPQISEQINLAFGTSINKDAGRRILAIHYRPTSTEGGASWLTFIGHMKDSLWSLDMFRCESIVLQTYWVLVVMDQYTRRIIGFGIQRGVVDGLALCHMFKQAIRGTGLPKYLSSDHDPLYRFHQWEANLRVLGVTEIKTVPYTPWSHPFVERPDRKNPQRMFGPVVVLNGNGFTDETDRFQRLLQRVPLSCGAEGRNGDRDSEIERRRAETLSFAETLPRLIPNTNCCMRTNSP